MTTSEYVCYVCGATNHNGGLIAVMDITQKYRLICPITECAMKLYSWNHTVLKGEEE